MATVKTSSLEHRFWSKVRKSEECWLWTGCKNSKGYGYIQRGLRGAGCVRVHRLRWQLANGVIPNGMQVLHHCDNPSCVRLDHLYLGDNKKNHEDKIRKGRQYRKASDEECDRMRGLFRLGYSIDAIAEVASVGRTQVWNIVTMRHRR